jgi:hypothetical protein
MNFASFDEIGGRIAALAKVNSQVLKLISLLKTQTDRKFLNIQEILTGLV